MGRFVSRERFAWTLLLVFLVGLVWMGCSNTVKRDEPAATAPASAATTAPPPVPSGKYQAKYYFFDDVLVPGELEYNQKKSFVYEAPQFKAGTLYFSKWNLDVDSVINFFLYNMEKDGWKMMTSYRGKESHLSFQKPDRSCNIRLTSSWLGKAYVEIRVGPVGLKKN